MKFMVMTDENIANAVAEQLVKKGVDAIRLIDVLDESTPDPDVLEYCYEQGYALITHDKDIRQHIASRISEDKEHAGIFIAGSHLQGIKGIGAIVNFIVFFNNSINEGAAVVKNDVYNRVIDID